MPDTIEKHLSDAELRLEEWLEQAMSIAGKVLSLDADARRQLPGFPPTYQKTEIAAYLRRLNEAVEQPLREAARKTVERLGIDATSLPDKAFQDAEELTLLSEAVARLQTALPEVAQHVLDQGWLAQDLRNDVSMARRRQEQLVDHQQLLRRLLAMDMARPLLHHVLDHVVQEPGALPRLQVLLDKVQRIKGYGVILAGANSWHHLEQIVTEISDNLDALQGDLGIQRDELETKLLGKPLDQVSKLLAERYRAGQAKREALRSEIGTYARLLGKSPIASDALPMLKRQASALRREAEEALGEQGMSLLHYWRGKREFPEDITMEVVRRTLEFLRPHSADTEERQDKAP